MTRPMVKLTVPDDIVKILEQLPQEIQKKSVRTGVRSAMVPMKHKVRALVKSLKGVSRQTSGATFRAVRTKYGSPKNQPYVYFGIVGVDKRNVEIITPRKADNNKAYQIQFKQAFKKDAKSRRTIRASLKKVKVSEVRSFRRKLSKRASPLKRVPNRYWHLINDGFIHARSKRGTKVQVQGYKFVEKAYAATVANAQSIFEKAMTKRIDQLFRKMAGLPKNK